MCFWYYYCCYLLSLDASTLTQGPFRVLSWKKWKLCFYFILHCHSCTYVFLVLLLLLFSVLGCFNIKTGTFGSVKLKEKLCYICYHVLFSFMYASITCSLIYYYCCYWLSLDASTLTQGPLGVLSWKKWKLCYICYHVVFSFTYAILTCSLIYYYCCYWLSLESSTLTQGPLGVLSWKKWPSLYDDDKT